MRRVGIRHRFARLPGATHFYPKTTRVSAVKESEGRDIESTIAGFLYDALKLR